MSFVSCQLYEHDGGMNGYGMNLVWEIDSMIGGGRVLSVKGHEQLDANCSKLHLFIELNFDHITLFLLSYNSLSILLR